MSVFDNLELGFATALTIQNLGMAFVGCLLGTLVGVLPGLGPLATMAMLLPLTYYAPAEGAVIMLAGIYYGAQYGGSTTAILINLPGESSSAVTCIDGNQMARQGRAGAALSIAALASFAAGTAATFIVALFAEPMTRFALYLAPADYFSLMLFGLVGATALSSGSALKSVGMVTLGIMLGLVGIDTTSGEPRFTGGFFQLYEGIDFIPIAIGIFGLADMIATLMKQPSIVGSSPHASQITSLWPTRQEVRQAWPAALRGTGVGSLLGLLPGGGAMLGSFASYVVERRISRTPERFGHGAVEGVAGPEAANNAGSQTAFIPMLTLGIPSNAIMAIMIGALMMQGIVPGPQVMAQRPELVWGLIASMWIGNLMLLVINLPLVGLWVSLLRVPTSVLFPTVVVICCIGAYGVSNSQFDVTLTAAFALLGYLLIRFDCPPAPLALGFILGPSMEEYFRRAMVLSRGNAETFVTHPVSLALLTLSALLVILLAMPHIRRSREEAFRED